MKSPSIPHPMYGNTSGHVYGLQTQNSRKTYPCVAQQTPAVSADGGSKKCTSTKESPVSVTFHPTWNRESHTYTRMDMQRQVSRSTGESSSPQDSQTTRTSCRTDNMRQCSSHYQRLKENACSMVTGMSQKAVHSQSLTKQTLRRPN